MTSLAKEKGKKREWERQSEAVETTTTASTGRGVAVRPQPGCVGHEGAGLAAAVALRRRVPLVLVVISPQKLDGREVSVPCCAVEARRGPHTVRLLSTASLSGRTNARSCSLRSVPQSRDGPAATAIFVSPAAPATARRCQRPCAHPSADPLQRQARQRGRGGLAASPTRPSIQHCVAASLRPAHERAYALGPALSERTHRLRQIDSPTGRRATRTAGPALRAKALHRPAHASAQRLTPHYALQFASRHGSPHPPNDRARPRRLAQEAQRVPREAAHARVLRATNGDLLLHHRQAGVLHLHAQHPQRERALRLRAQQRVLPPVLLHAAAVRHVDSR